MEKSFRTPIRVLLISRRTLVRAGLGGAATITASALVAFLRGKL